MIVTPTPMPAAAPGESPDLDEELGVSEDGSGEVEELPDVGFEDVPDWDDDADADDCFSVSYPDLSND